MPPAGGVNGQDAVLGPLHDEERDVDLREVAAEVGLPRGHTGQGGIGRRAGRHREAGVPGLGADAGAGELVDVVEL